MTFFNPYFSFICQSLKASAEATDLLQSMRVVKERLERDLERIQHKEDSSDSLRRRLRETEVSHTSVFISVTLQTSLFKAVVPKVGGAPPRGGAVELQGGHSYITMRIQTHKHTLSGKTI